MKPLGNLSNKLTNIKLFITAYVVRRTPDCISQSLIEKLFNGDSTLNEIHNWLNDHDGEELTLLDVKFNYIDFELYENYFGKEVVLLGEQVIWNLNQAIRNKGVFTPKLIK